MKSAEFSPERNIINKMLIARQWFKNTDSNICARILGLPENCNGFLQDLASRTELIGSWQLIKIVQISLPMHQKYWAIFVVFELKNQQNESLNWQYLSWRQGPASGVKGIVLVRDKDTHQFTHIIMLNSLKFGAGIFTHDCIGGFAEENEITDFDMRRRFQTELVEELGLETLPPHEIIDLGRFHPDAGMTNNKPFLMAAIISSEQFPLLTKPGLPNPDHFESTNKIIIPFSELAQLIDTCNDSFLHVCLTRLWVKGLFIFPAIYP